MKRRIGRLLLIGFAVLALTACATYYQVNDPASDNVYYTRSIDEERGGAIRFVDEKTGNQVTLQNSEVKEIDKKEYRQALGK